MKWRCGTLPPADPMRYFDPQTSRLPQPKTTVVFAASQLQGSRETQEDFFINFNEECFVVADGVGGMPHGEVAAKLAAETALWGYKLIRQRRCYWLNKELFIKRIFRSTNLAVWQKRRERGFTDGLATTLLVCMIGEKNFWIGHVGDSSAWLFRDSVTKLTKDDLDSYGRLTKVVGVQRLGLIPQFVSGAFREGDSILLLTDGVANFLTEKDMTEAFIAAGTTTESMTDAVALLLSAAERNGSTDNMTAVLIKRVAITSGPVVE